MGIEPVGAGSLVAGPTDLATMILCREPVAYSELGAAFGKSFGFVTFLSVFSDLQNALRDGSTGLVLAELQICVPNGVSGIRRLRQTAEVPIIAIASRPKLSEEIACLRAGADDYLVAPVPPQIALERARAIWRRMRDGTELSMGGGGRATDLVRGNLVMDPARHQVTWNASPVSLSATEFQMLKDLVHRPNIVKTRDQLAQAAGLDCSEIDTRVVDSHIKRLRRKLRQVDPGFQAIETLYGLGYRFSLA